MPALSAQSFTPNPELNRIDKNKRKQGDWIFYDKDGYVKMSTAYKHDSCVSPLIFYKKSDTAFVRLPKKGITEPFILYRNKTQYFGEFIYSSDSTCTIEMYEDSIPDPAMLNTIKEYWKMSIPPVYFFAQKKLEDFLSAMFHSLEISFNKQINALLTINAAGVITNVEFPTEHNDISSDIQNELYRYFMGMPRWQPYFVNGKTRPVKLFVSQRSDINIIP